MQTDHSGGGDMPLRILCDQCGGDDFTIIDREAFLRFSCDQCRASVAIPRPHSGEGESEAGAQAGTDSVQSE